MLDKHHFLYFLLSFFFGLLIATFFWQKESILLTNKTARTNIDSLVEEQLKEQIGVLREENRQLKDKLSSPPQEAAPTPIPFVKKDNLQNANLYKLSCQKDLDGKKIDFDWWIKVSPLLNGKEALMEECFNEELQKVVFWANTVSTESKITGILKLYVYDLINHKLDFLTTEQASWLSGCSDINYWTRNGNIYYKCGAGDGPWASSKKLKVNLETKVRGVVEQCDYFEDKKYCSSYCDQFISCGSGSFCDLSTHSCVQSCVKDDDCVQSQCSAFGPVMGCK